MIGFGMRWMWVFFAACSGPQVIEAEPPMIQDRPPEPKWMDPEEQKALQDKTLLRIKAHNEREAKKAEEEGYRPN